MSDNSISIVPKQSSYPNNKAQAKKILDWLVSKDIVKPTLSDCISSSDNGYTPSEGARLVTAFPEDLQLDFLTNGLEIITERQVFDTGENGIEELTCPHCKENIATEDWNFLTPWNNKDSDNLTCPLCGHKTGIHNFTFDPEWGFSDLGFKFWNWPEFTDEFIEEFRMKLNCEIALVYQRI
jgi:hypothetical protein